MGRRFFLRPSIIHKLFKSVSPTKRAKRVTIYPMKRFRQKLLYALCLCLIVGLSGVAMALPEGLLSVGDYGSDVIELQSELAAAGFYSGEISGTYTTDTRDAVIALQKALGVEIDGIYGPATAVAYEAALAQDYFGAAKNGAALPLNGLIIGVDPGHQAVEDPALEPMQPGSNRTKPRMTKGAVGIKTGAPECRINLQIGLKLKGLLEGGGATVIMTRESSDVSISNLERAQRMNEAGVDIWIRLHCDASSSERQSGSHALVPSRAYSADIYKESLALAQSVLDRFCETTGAANGGVSALINQTGFNWSERPVMAIEMGYLSNAEDDVRLGRDSYQIACATGIYNGIVAYYQAK